jgi:serine/threonine protein phosphatase PrpC
MSAQEAQEFDTQNPQFRTNSHKEVIKQLRDVFVGINQQTSQNVPNCLFSGTTCSVVLTRGPQVISANAGDSRAIIVDKFGKAKQLSRDHKPDCEDEHKRIMAAGGRVRALLNHQMGGIEVGP